jgi:hypothetical protein
LDDLKSARLIIQVLELHAKPMAKHVSTNNVNHNDERESGTDENGWIQVVTGQKKKSLKKTKLSSDM